MGYVDPSGHEACPAKESAINKLKEEGLSDAEAEAVDQKMRDSGMTPEEIANRNSNGDRYTEAYFEGTTTVGGEERDISRKIYQRNDIYWDRVDPKTGLTNREIALNGGSPYWSDGTKVELHHLLQKEPGPMVEIPASMHDKYYKPLHGLIGDGESFRNNPVLNKQYKNYRRQYWIWRAKNL